MLSFRRPVRSSNTGTEKYDTIELVLEVCELAASDIESSAWPDGSTAVILKAIGNFQAS
jgi:hypothetical protein